MRASPPAALAPVLEMREVRRLYGARAALDGVSLRVEAGEIYALLGRNGAGKSTLARAATGAIALHGGEVRVLGLDPGRDRSVRRFIGVAPQEIALYPRLTIAENLHALAAMSGMSRADRPAAVARALEHAACASRAGERVERLSGGWRRRANLAAALVHSPRLLVLDEPGEGFDAETRAVFSTVLRHLRDQGVAVLLISHDAAEVAAVADRIGIMHQGRLIAEGDPQTLLHQAFGAREQLILRLVASASPHTERLLSGGGLAPGSDPLTWEGVVENAAAHARSLHDGLGELGVGFRELVVRPPSLDQLVARHHGEAVGR